MGTRVFTAKDNQMDSAEWEEAVSILRSGGLVAFPTETVYGLGGDATNPEAAQKIYQAKGRPSDNPLIVHIADLSQLGDVVAEMPEIGRRLAEHFWPGPLTMILKKSDTIPYETTGGLDTVAVRMPSHPIAQLLLKKSGVMIAAPSANASGRPSPTTAAHVWEDLRNRIDAIIDGGTVGIGIESTIIDLTEDNPLILRPGFVTKEMLEDVIGPVGMDPGLEKENTKVRPKAPGMRYRHYAPRAELTLVEGSSRDVVAKINDMTEVAMAKGQRVGILATEETKREYCRGEVVSVGKRRDEAEIAGHLYAVLRRFDDLGVDVIYSESFDDSGVGQAVMNRLLKAAGYRRISAGEDMDRVHSFK